MRSKDRLPELRQLASEGLVYNDTVEVFLGHEVVGGGTEEIDQIFEEVDRMRGWIKEINRNSEQIRRIYTDPIFHTDQKMQEHLDSLITQSNAVGLKVCGALRQFEPRATSKRGDVASRLAKLQYATTRQLYSDALARHDENLQILQRGQYDLLQEKIKLTNLTISEEECQNLLETRNIQLFVDNIQAETQEARLALRDVESRHQELLRIENSIREVHELFVQMSHLVSQQQELVDTVEYYASQASQQVGYGGQELLKGKVSKSKARKKKLGLIICLVSGFLIVLFVLIAT